MIEINDISDGLVYVNPYQICTMIESDTYLAGETRVITKLEMSSGSVVKTQETLAEVWEKLNSFYSAGEVEENEETGDKITL